MPLLVLALVAFLGFGFVWLLLSIARWAPPDRIDGETITFRHGQLLRAFAVIVFFGVPFAMGLMLIAYPPRSNLTMSASVVVAALFGLAGFLLTWEAFQYRLVVSPAGLECRSPWKGRFTQTWDSVTAVEYSTVNMWFVLIFQGGSEFHVSTLVPGVSQFLEACERRLTPEQMAGAKRGYGWVRRKWPHGANLP